MIQPLTFTKTAETRDVPEASIVFPYATDCGTEIKDIAFFLVYNGFDHYCGVKYPFKHFKDGCKELYNLLSQARTLGDNLAQCVKVPTVKDIMSKASEHAITSLYAVDTMMQAAPNVNLEEDESGAKKRKLDKEAKTRKTKTGTTSFKEFTCACGVPKSDKEDLKSHRERRHSNNNWRCIIEDCKFSSHESKRLKKHVQNIHFKEFYHFCKYCPKGCDDKHVIQNHMSRDHQLGVNIPCRKLGCQKMFGSVVSRNRHESFCGEGKKYICSQYPPCKKGFKRESNFLNHVKLVHTGETAMVFCKICLKKYQTQTSYKAHLKNAQCKPRELDEIGEDELKQIEDQLIDEEGDDDIEEVEGEEPPETS